MTALTRIALALAIIALLWLILPKKEVKQVQPPCCEYLDENADKFTDNGKTK